MSNNTTPHDSSTDDILIKACCGHTVPQSEICYIDDYIHCVDCYLKYTEPWFGIDDCPTVLEKRSDTARDGRGTSTVTGQISLVGITEDRTALYHDAIDGRLWTVVPAHSDFHDTDDALRMPLRDIHHNCTLGASASTSDDDFHTLPNGDHLALIETAEVPYCLNEWLVAHADEFHSFTDEYAPSTQ